MPDAEELEIQLRSKVNAFLDNEAAIDGFNTADHIAVALILNRKDLLDRIGFTMLEAFDRLELNLLRAARNIERRPKSR